MAPRVHLLSSPLLTLAVGALLAISTAAQSATDKSISTIARETNSSVVRIILRDQSGKELASGSGFVATADCKVVTNYHVIQIPGATQAELKFTDGASYQAAGVLASDTDADIAVLKLSAVAKECPALHLGDSERVQVGEHVVAIGSPLAGLTTLSTEATVSDGIVSGIRDWPEHKVKVLQITAPISPGSSGGALANLQGEVIGVTFAQITGGQNLNFAIPIDRVRPLLAENGPAKPLSETVVIPKEITNESVGGLTGTYTGAWQSGKFSASGVATMTVTMSGNAVSAEVFLTGSELTREILTGTGTKVGERVWTVELKAQHAKLSIRGVFRDDTFVGDYRYHRFALADLGQWILRKE